MKLEDFLEVFMHGILESNVSDVGQKSGDF
jgi:hypothetical protein